VTGPSSPSPEPGVVLSIVVPVFDEIDNLAPLAAEVAALAGRLPPFELILVDDGSRDGGWARIVELARQHPFLRGLRFLGNQGQTAAMAAGIEAARGNLVAFLDADLQNDPADLPALLAPIERGEADVVCGWRRHRKDRAVTRVLPSLVANRLISTVLGLPLHDVGCTLKVFRKIYLEDVQLYGEMHRFIPAYAAAQGARLVEVETNHRPRTHGRSKYGLARTYKILVDLLTVKMLNAYGSKPAYFFGKLAFLLGAFASALFVLVAWRVLVLHRLEATPAIFVMVVLYISSLLCLMSGLLAELMVRILHRVGGRQLYRIVDRTGEGSDGGPGSAGSPSRRPTS
jgi:glycosyltransferase involved in cell wall biosynthesis